MATVSIKRLKPFAETQAHAFYGKVTGTLYGVDQLGRAIVDSRDAAYLVPEGWVYEVAEEATSGNAVLDFGVFPGSPTASVTVVAADAADPTAILTGFVTAVATVDHSAVEHVADPPRVTAVADGLGNVIIYGFPSGRDLYVPAATPFGNKANSQAPVDQQQMQPYGKWSVGYAFQQ